MSDDLTAKAAMLEQCRIYYANNRRQLADIDRFESEYRANDAVRWYTKDCFIYRLVNKALRTEEIEHLFLFRFYIADLCLHLRALKQEQRQYTDNGIWIASSITVYRGIRESSRDLDLLRANIGCLISINGFLSASRDESVALIFAGVNTLSSVELACSVILEIHANMTLQDVTAADIAHLSDHPDEQEVLFDMGTTFLVEHLAYDNEHALWRCVLVATEDGARFVSEHVSFYTNEMQGTNTDVRFGALLVDMCAYSKAEAYLNKLLLQSDRADMAHIHFHLGRICHFQSGYERAMTHLHRALALERNALNIARIMQEIGIQLYQRGDCIEHDDYGDGMRWNERAYELYVINGHANSSNAAYCLNNIGHGLHKKQKFARALEFHMRALKIRQSILPRDHALIAQSLRNLGLEYCKLGECNRALDYNTKALEIVQRTVPDVHWSRAHTLRNIGIIHHRQGDMVHACEKLQEALNIYQSVYGHDHPDIARTQSMIESARNGFALPFW
ncbi:unnamed protein product [Rotaria sp. Silwood2]|nr:unnamed protein product [Rotaria sp. Silwood2]CAF4450538.1 unnamed protein product [Rotaria sp. Silwood2]